MTKIIHSNLFLSVILQIIAKCSLKVEIGSVVPERIKLKKWKANSILHKKRWWYLSCQQQMAGKFWSE